MNSQNAPKRFCRRCKKVRSEEEPPDIRKYKTCKLCREIERKKKRLKKLNNMNVVDSSIVNDALNYSKMLPNINDPIQQINEHQNQNQIHESPSPSIESDLNINDEMILPLNECEICGKTRNNQDNGRYKLCEQCLYDPTSNSNVENDFNQYLIKLNKNSTIDINNLIFYKNISTDILPIPIDNSNPSFTEYNKKKCEITLNNINNFFIKPIMNVTGFQFSRTSSNLSIKPYPKTLKALYRCKQDLKTSTNQTTTQDEKINYRILKNQNCDSYLYISFDLITRLLTIKFSHKTHRNFFYKNYSNELISIIIKNFEQGKKNNCIYNELKTNNEYDFLANEISMIRKTTFLRDFNNDFLSNELIKLKNNNENHEHLLKNLIQNEKFQSNEIYYNLDPEISNLQERLTKPDITNLQERLVKDENDLKHGGASNSNNGDNNNNIDDQIDPQMEQLNNQLNNQLSNHIKNEITIENINNIDTMNLENSTSINEIDPLLNQ